MMHPAIDRRIPMAEKEKWDNLPTVGGFKRLKRLPKGISAGFTAGDIKCLRPNISFKECEEIIKNKKLKTKVEKAMLKAGKETLDESLPGK